MRASIKIPSHQDRFSEFCLTLNRSFRDYDSWGWIPVLEDVGQKKSTASAGDAKDEEVMQRQTLY
jgi:hypothetical protein